APLSILAVTKAGGWQGVSANIPRVMTHSWTYLAHSSENPMGVEIFGLVSGLGFVLSFGYWCTDFLVIQRALAAEDLAAAQRTPLIAAFPKVFFPAITILPGMLALVLVPAIGSNNGNLSYNQALPLMLGQLYPTGMLGIGLTA